VSGSSRQIHPSFSAESAEKYALSKGREKYNPYVFSLRVFPSAYAAQKKIRINKCFIKDQRWLLAAFPIVIRCRGYSEFDIRSSECRISNAEFPCLPAGREQRSQHNSPKKIMRTQPYLKSPLHIIKPNIFFKSLLQSLACEMDPIIIIMRSGFLQVLTNLG